MDNCSVRAQRGSDCSAPDGKLRKSKKELVRATLEVEETLQVPIVLIQGFRGQMSSRDPRYK